MESEENKIEVDELDLGFFFNSCKSLNMLGVYRLGKKSNEIKKMIVLGDEQVVAHSNLFTYYE
jgi:hypothetical protein